jgi:hypothetical protein
VNSEIYKFKISAYIGMSGARWIEGERMKIRRAANINMLGNMRQIGNMLWGTVYNSKWWMYSLVGWSPPCAVPIQLVLVAGSAAQDLAARVNWENEHGQIATSIQSACLSSINGQHLTWPALTFIQNEPTSSVAIHFRITT